MTTFTVHVIDVPLLWRKRPTGRFFQVAQVRTPDGLIVASYTLPLWPYEADAVEKLTGIRIDAGLESEDTKPI